MSGSRSAKIWAGVAGAFGVAAAGTAIGVARQQRSISRRVGEEVPFGTLHGTEHVVEAADGVELLVEIDEVADHLEPSINPLRRWRSGGPGDSVTLVFAHGYCLDMGTWHFQRAAYRGLVRSVFYDQRSHGRSGRSDRAHSTIAQLGDDLATVIEECAPDGPVVLVGHSMGAMSIMSLAERHPDLIGDRVVGAMLVATAAGDLDPVKIVVPMLPARLSMRTAPVTSRVTNRAVTTLSRGHRIVDLFRRAGGSVAIVAADIFAFGGDVPASYVAFTDHMLSNTPFEVVADFFGSFGDLDLYHALPTLSRIPVTVIGATSDRVTSIKHSREIAENIDGSRLVEADGAGHMVVFERHDLVTSELDQLVTTATAGRVL